MHNVGFIIYDFTKKGGAERASAKLANELVKKNNVTIISVFNKNSETAYLLDQKINLYKIFDSEGHILRNISIITRKIYKIIKKHNIDVIFSIDIATAFISILVAKFAKVRLIVCDRSSCYNATMYSRLNLRVYAWLGIHMSDIYQVMTEEGKKGCIRKYHIKDEKVVVIPNWIDDNAIINNTYCHDNKKIISVGRATPEKNYEELINIAEKIKPFCCGWKWHIWGDFNSQYGAKLLKTIKERNLDDFLIYKGTTNQIYNEYSKYSFFVMTSKFEGMPNVILEAQGSKLPIIAYDCKTGPSELIKNGINGFLVKLNDTQQMQKEILNLVNDKMLAEKISSQSNINYEKYSKRLVLEKWDVVLNEGDRYGKII